MTSCGPRPQASYHSHLPFKERLEVKHGDGRGPRRAARSRSGNTPLDRAAIHGYAETVAALLAAGADKARRGRSDVVEMSERGGEERLGPGAPGGVEIDWRY